MAGRYERVSAHDDEEPETPIATPRQTYPIPNSPPPSFHSRASSLERRNQMNPTLADAFDADGDESDEEADDRQRLVRPSIPAAPSDSAATNPAASGAEGRSLHSSSTSRAAPAGGRVFGGGIQSDGVFSNLTAKPDLSDAEKDEQPPTYEQAAADQAPPYWETTILAPGLGGPDEVYIDGMPVGSVFGFVWNGMISWSFQIVGFLLTYLLHSTHAAKNGSRAGLGITLIKFGFDMKAAPGNPPPQMNGPDGYANPPDPNSHDFDPNTVTNGDDGGSIYDISGADWLAYVLMVVGWFILIRAISDYLHARRHEQLVLQSPDRGLGVAVVAEGESSERVV